jgi:hypothetical protein
VTTDRIADQFTHWLKFGAGCMFATRFARGSDQRLSIATHVGSLDEVALELLNGHFRGAAKTEQMASPSSPK